MRLQLSKRVHLDVDAWLCKQSAFGATVGSHVWTVWPFQGYWFNAEVDLGRFIATIYIGE